MPQSLSQVIIHVVFSTKDRAALIPPEMQPRLHAYLAEVARGLGCHAYRVGGVADHVHLALTLPRTLPQGDLVKELKTVSNHWLGKQDAGYLDFAWQRGYGIFSVGKSQLAALERYIENQAAKTPPPISAAPTAHPMTAWGFNPRLMVISNPQERQRRVP